MNQRFKEPKSKKVNLQIGKTNLNSSTKLI